MSDFERLTDAALAGAAGGNGDEPKYNFQVGEIYEGVGQFFVVKEAYKGDNDEHPVFTSKHWFIGKIERVDEMFPIYAMLLASYPKVECISAE